MLSRLATGAMRSSDDQALYVETKTFSEGACLLHCFCFWHSTCGKAHKQTRRGRSERQKQPPPNFLSEIVQYWTALYPELADRYTSNLIV
jgi:hypothetical protein